MGRETSRNTIALAGASLAASAVVTLGTIAFLAPNSDTSMLAAAPAWFMMNFLACAAASATLGLPWHAFAQRCGWTSIHAYWLPAGAAGALIALAIFIVLVLSTGGNVPTVRGDGPVFRVVVSVLIGYGAALGSLAGLFAWLIRRPDRDPPNPATRAP